MLIRRAAESDYEQIWKIFSEVIKAGDTYVFDPATSKSEMQELWFADNMATFVAEVNGELVGTYMIKPNQIGLGNHIANCGYMVSSSARGQGIGKQMCEHSIDFARRNGYIGIQFNIVVSTNTRAVELWKKNGFQIIGTTPKGFRHAALGFVDTFIMYKEL
jgi:GNAT superfamily N-acetyltransferase